MAPNDDAAPVVPMASSARDLLHLPGSPGVAWAEFDAAWYLRAYPAARAALAEPTDAAALAYYLDRGQTLGHSPNPFFDETFFLSVHANIARAVREGRAASGFDVYCRHRGAERYPHWLFDEVLYRKVHVDLTDEVLASSGLVNGYGHFLRHGAREGRAGSLFFDAAIYRASLPPAAAEAAEAVGMFVDCINRLQAGGAGAERPCSPYFDPLWYLRTYPEVAQGIAEARYLSALHHYLTNDTPTDFDPLPLFSEKFYLQLYPDIARAVAEGKLRNGFHHFLFNGVFELRTPSEAFDPRYYVDAHRSVSDGLRGGAARDALSHYLLIGRTQGLYPVQPPDEKFSEGQAKTLFRLRAQTLVPLLARRPLDFSNDGAPAISVVMVAHDRFALTLQALASVRANFAGGIDMILVDSGSTDETKQIERCVRGATVLRFDTNIGFLKGSNAGLQAAMAPVVLLLNNDVDLAPGAIAAALDRLASDPKIGAVGAKVVRTHGRLQEAGCIIWRDGATHGYMRDASPAAPEANFVRDVDFCSALFLMVRGDLLQQLDGFAPDFAPAYYEDADLCVRIAQAGYRVVYDPSAVVHHLEYGSAASASALEAEMSRARQVFLLRHADYLRTRHEPGAKAAVFARHANREQRRILFIEDQVPLRMIGSGFVRSNDLVSVMAGMGFHVTVFPIHATRFDLASVHAELPDTVEVMHDRTLEDLAAFLDRRAGYYDAIWIARTHNLDRVRPILDAALAGADRPPRLVLDTEAIAALRAGAQAELTGQQASFDFDAALDAEFANATFCQRIVAVNEQEAWMLRGLGLPNVSVIGHMRTLAPTPRRFKDRQGMLFVGAMHGVESPNHDSLCWFVDAVLPLIEEALGWETRLTIAGYIADGAALDRFRDHRRITLRGAVADMRPLYDAHRIFIAPTRYAAGTPYKVHEAASFGLPVVASELLRRQTGWQDGKELLAAPTTDPMLFAQQIVTLYRDRTLWQSLRDGALTRLAAENGRERYVEAVRAVLE